MAADVYLGVISVQMWLTSHRQDEITQGGSVGGLTPEVFHHKDGGGRGRISREDREGVISEVGENQETGVSKNPNGKGKRSFNSEGVAVSSDADRSSEMETWY